MADIPGMSGSKGPAALAHVRLFGPRAAGLCAGPFRWTVSADPTAHLNATLLLLGLFALAGAVPIPSPLRKRGMQNFCAKESAGAVELTEVTESDNGIHGVLETAGGLRGGGEETPSASQPLPAQQSPPAALERISRLPSQQGRSPRQPASQRAWHQVRGKLGRQNMVPAYKELQWRRESVIQGSHGKHFSQRCDRARRWSAQRRTRVRGTVWQIRHKSRPQGSGGHSFILSTAAVVGDMLLPSRSLPSRRGWTNCSPMVTALGRKVWQVWGRDSLEEGCDFGHRDSLSGG